MTHLQHQALAVAELELNRRRGVLRTLGPEERALVEELAQRVALLVADDLVERSREEPLLRAALATIS
jgi:hypothetical protein